MGYTFQCDCCREDFRHAPPFMGELTERFIKTSDSPLVEKFEIGQTITFCRKCAEEILL